MLKNSKVLLSAYCIFAAFTTYFCMFAFRKPFTSATFEGLILWGIDYKIVLIIAQVLGYGVAKGIGIKVISEVKPENRAKMILAFIGMAELSLILFALTPAPYNFVFLFFNGLPLGMIFGLVLGFLEGRQITEILGAGLCVSFIVASGAVKSVGKLLLGWGISEFWMPALTGLLFLPLLFFSVWMLKQIPPPTKEDQAERSLRQPMSAADRKAFFNNHALGLIALISVYVLVTILRDIRDNFAVEIWKELHITNAGIFTVSETWVGLGITVLTGILFVFKDNKLAFWINHVFIGFGVLTIAGVTYLFNQHMISSFSWMIIMGLGIFMAYVPYNCMLFERLIAVTRQKSNIGFLLSIADFSAYIGSVIVLFYKNFGTATISWLSFIKYLAYIIPGFAILFLLISFGYFRQKLSNTEKT